MPKQLMIKEPLDINIVIESADYRLIQEIAAIESTVVGRKIHAADLIRDALKFVYRDNERLRECFRRARQANSKSKLKNKY